MTLPGTSRSIIFLDIDGVLVNAESLRWGYEPGTRGPPPHPACLAALTHLTRATNPIIVLSSTWRHRPDWPRLLRAWGLSGPFGGHTPFLERVQGGFWVSAPRSAEIQAWLDRFPSFRRFVILDDLPTMDHLTPHLIRTQFETGLTQIEAERAIAHLHTPSLT